MSLRAVVVTLPLLLIAVASARPARLRTTVRTPIIRRGIRKAANGHYFEYITKAQTRNPPAEYRIEKGPNGQYWEVTIRKTIHTHEGRRRKLSSSASGQTAILPRTQTGAGLRKPSSSASGQTAILPGTQTDGTRLRKPSSFVSGQKATLPRTQTLSGTNSMPQTCDCEPTRSRSTGECWYFTKKGSNYCMKRPCRLKFLCTSRKTGLTCMLRKTTSKVVPTSNNKCVEERVSGFLYAPYSAY